MCAGLHAYKLKIRGITVNGQEAKFEQRQYCVDESLPQDVLEGMFQPLSMLFEASHGGFTEIELQQGLCSTLIVSLRSRQG